MEVTHVPLNAAPDAEDLDKDNAPGAVPGVSVQSLADAPERSLLDAAAAAARAEQPLKIRTALQVYDPEAKPYGHFRGWRGQAWTIAVPGADAARKFREVVELLFDYIQVVGVDHAHLQLRDLRSRYKSE